MRFELTKEEYELIRDAIENYYDTCEGDGEYRAIIPHLDALERKLIEQAKE